MLFNIDVENYRQRRQVRSNNWLIEWLIKLFDSRRNSCF